jgi:hypothetical protein
MSDAISQPRMRPTWRTSPSTITHDIASNTTLMLHVNRRAAGDQPSWLQAQDGADHLPFFRGVCARSLAAAVLSSLDDFGLASTLPAAEAAAGPVPPLEPLPFAFAFAIKDTPPFGLICGEHRDVMQFPTRKANHSLAAAGARFLQRWAPAVLSALGLPAD